LLREKISEAVPLLMSLQILDVREGDPLGDDEGKGNTVPVAKTITSFCTHLHSRRGTSKWHRHFRSEMLANVELAESAQPSRRPDTIKSKFIHSVLVYDYTALLTSGVIRKQPKGRVETLVTSPNRKASSRDSSSPIADAAAVPAEIAVIWGVIVSTELFAGSGTEKDFHKFPVALLKISIRR
jgi:hypothetical protein